MRKLTFYFFVFAMAFLVVLTGCRKLCVPHQYDFNGGISTIYPDKDSIHIGDTLWFNCSFPINLKFKNFNSADSEIVNFSGASNVGTDINFHAIPKVDTLTDALDSFVLIPSKGILNVNSLVPHGAENITFLEQGGNYEMSFGIVAQKRGTYVITIIDVYRIEKKCAKASVTIPIISTVNQHLYFLDSLYFPGSRYEPAIPNYELTHDYCFKVY